MIKMINSERINTRIASIKGCDIPQNDHCYAGDIGECTDHALDICAIKDLASCTGYAEDVCLLQKDYFECNGNEMDYT